MKILLPDVAFDLAFRPLLDDDVRRALPEDAVVPYAMREAVPEEHTDADVLVTWANPPALTADAARRLTRLRWVQTLSAGPDVALSAGFGEAVTIASGRSLHDETVAEHTLMLILASVRRLPDALRAQHEHRWAGEMAAAQADPATDAHWTLSGARVVLWGFGSIAERLAPLLAALGAHVTGVAGSAGTRAGFDVVGPGGLDALLPTTDVLVSLLPSVPGTRHALDADVLAALPRHARFVNAGRGSTVDEAALVDALRSGRLAGAALDVMQTEPLPADSPLWDCPGLVLTPHVAGGRPRGAARFLAGQVTAWVRDGAAGLRNVVRAGSADRSTTTGS